MPGYELENHMTALLTSCASTSAPALQQVASKGVIKIASLCAGMDVTHIVLDRLHKAWSLQDLPPLQFELLSCEINEWKRAGLLARDRLGYNVLPKHVVGDMALLPGPLLDYMTGQPITVSNMDVVVAGFCCQDLSPLNGKAIPFHPTSPGVSARTFYGTLRLVSIWRPPVVILENVVGVLHARKCDDGQRPSNTMTTAFNELGYEVRFQLLDSRAFLPQRRKRVWFVCILREHFRNQDPFAFCMLAAPSHMFGLEHVLDVAGREQRDCEPQDSVPKAPGKDKLRKPAGASLKWPGHTANFIRAKKLQECVLKQCRAELAKNMAWCQLPQRERFLLVTSYAFAWQHWKISPFRSTIIVQTDQAVQRAPKGIACCPCVVPKGRYWLSSYTGQDGRKQTGRFLRTAELARLQGLGDAELRQSGFDLQHHGRLRDLIGNSFSAPLFAAVLLGSLTCWDR